ncbi:MAG: hypothetical protein LBB40_03285 [Holophagales bacterium]|nr:hypothetical protein [Holophagales bacterium]
MIYTGKRNNTWGFFLDKNGVDPCVELTEEQHAEIFAKHSSGLLIKWHDDGTPYLEAPPPPPPPTLEQITAQYTDAVQNRLDAFARTRGYDGIMSACTYVTSAVPQFRLEAAYCVTARDATWAQCYQVMGAVLAGEQDMPTLEELFETLPKLEWPESEA